MDKRQFLIGTGASLIAAPAIVSIFNIMPVRSLPQWEKGVIWGADFVNNRYLMKGITYHSFEDFASAGGIIFDRESSNYQLTSKGLWVGPNNKLLLPKEFDVYTL